MTTSASTSAAVLATAQVGAILESFCRDGYALILGIPAAQQCAHWRQRTDDLAKLPEMKPWVKMSDKATCTVSQSTGIAARRS